MIDDTTKTAKANMEKTLEALSHEFATVRTGRATGAILEHVMVDYYGTPTPVTQLAGIKSPDAHLLVVEPWDKSSLGAIEKAILASDLGITPSNDGSVVRLPFPAPTEERRRELVKQCKVLAEESRVSIRNVRRDANSKIDAAKKQGEIGEDEARRGEEAIQKLTDLYIDKVEEVLKAKEEEVMEV